MPSLALTPFAGALGLVVPARQVVVATDPLEALIARVREGDLTAFEALYRQTRSDVHRILFRLIGSNSDIDDLIQEVFIQLLRALRGFRGDARFTTFLYRICANVGLMHLRSKCRRREDLVADLPEPREESPAGPERSAQAHEAARLLEDALDQLTEEKRVVFVYHELLSMGPEEIALVLSIPVNTVRSRLGRAREEVVALVARHRREPGAPAGGPRAR